MAVTSDEALTLNTETAMSKADHAHITGETEHPKFPRKKKRAPASRSEMSIAELVRERDALNVRLKELSELTSEADCAWSDLDLDPKSEAVFREFYRDAERREYAVDDELADVCSTILTQPPTSADDLVLKAKTVAFIAQWLDVIWDEDKFQDEIVAFADQVAKWMGGKNG
jgi:hypothetical protein